MKWMKRHISRIAWTVIVTIALILHKNGLIYAWIFYTLLIAMHAWIFTRIGIGIYNLKHKKDEKKNCCG